LKSGRKGDLGRPGAGDTRKEKHVGALAKWKTIAIKCSNRKKQGGISAGRGTPHKLWRKEIFVVEKNRLLVLSVILYGKSVPPGKKKNRALEGCGMGVG